VAEFITILLVEDDSAVRDVVVRVLAEKGFGVLTANDAYEAIRILAERHVDVLFADIVLPGGMDGVQLAKQARLMRPAIRVLFQTGYVQRATEREAFRIGRVLFKPLRQPDIVRALEQVLAA
jgi:CheY-like chemotaxis protein